jgi:hypothetical protein
MLPAIDAQELPCDRGRIQKVAQRSRDVGRVRPTAQHGICPLTGEMVI